MTGPKFRRLGASCAVELTTELFRDGLGLCTSPFLDSGFWSAVARPLFRVRDVSSNVSAKDVLRGVHCTPGPPGRAMYVRWPNGGVARYLADLRVGLPTYGRWETTELGAGTERALDVQIDVGHAFLAYENDSVIVCVISEEFALEREWAVSAFDPEPGLDTPPKRAATKLQRGTVAINLPRARALGILPEHRSCQDTEAALWP